MRSRRSSPSTIRLVSAQETWPIRTAALWPDADPRLVALPDDDVGIHLGAFRDGVLASVLSLFPDASAWRLRKFATLPELQGCGLGSALLLDALERARNAGARGVWCDARAEAVAFYARFGFRAEGFPFEKSGRPYIRMSFAANTDGRVFGDRPS